MEKKLWYILPIFIWVIMICLLIHNSINTWEQLIGIINRNFFRYLFFSLLITFLSEIIISLFYYYYNKEKAIKKHGDMTYRIGHDITRLLSWPFSANGLLFLITFAAISLIVFVMIIHGGSGTNKKVGSGVESGELQLVAITLSITLATIIPFIISKIAAKRELEHIIDERLKQELNKFDTSITKILATNAHSSRMSAVSLYQMAEQQKQDAENGNKKLFEDALKNAAWSVGWASTAITEYVLIKDSFSDAIKHSKELLNYYLMNTTKFINECEEKIKEDKEKEKSSESEQDFDWEKFKKEKKFVQRRDLISLFTMHAIVKKYDVIKILEKKDNENNTVDEGLTMIEGILLKYLEKDEIPNAKECYIPEKDCNFNEELRNAVIQIIKEAKKR